MKFQRKTAYYPQPTHEFNLPAGWTCPWADNCLTKADRHTGKQIQTGRDYRCYAAAAERFPSARDSRWHNFEEVKRLLKTTPTDQPFDIPARATHIRIHGSGDFFNQNYFDRWLVTARANPPIKFWAYTKSIGYWVARLHDIPDNLTLQASRGSKQDHLIDAHSLKCAEVFPNIDDVPATMQIDTDDTLAMHPGPSFALLDNFTNHHQATDQRIAEHNRNAARGGTRR